MICRVPTPTWLTILYYIFYSPVEGMCYLFRLPYAAYKKHKQKKPIRPLPRDRKRSLTLPLPNSSSPWYRKDSRQKTFDQSQSPFFRLPRELRDIIYHQVIVPSDGADLHVTIMGHRLCGIPCGESDSSHRGWKHKCWKPTDWRNYSTKHLDPCRSRSRGYFGLLQSCRKMYSESIDFLYTGSTLNVRSTKTIMAMEKVMVSHRLNSISSLHLDTEAIYRRFNTKNGSLRWPTDVLWYWKGACDVLSKMQGLQNLKISLTRGEHWGYLEPDIDGLAWLLQPLMVVKQVSNFNVDIYWSRPIDLEGLQRELGGKPPFRLEVVVTYLPDCRV